MKAIICDKYGLPSDLQLKEIPKPVPKENEVLIKIKATSINDYDWRMVIGEPKIYRLLFGLRKPKHPIPGMELSGIVEQVGKQIEKFKTGDAVYGDISEYGFGTYAEYICINEKALVHKPQEMSFPEAAAIPHASLLAYQGLVDIGKIKSGDKVLINGAGGGVGFFGLQIAKMYGCEVTGVDTGEKLKIMESQGFDYILDYQKEDFTMLNKQYDLILDAKTTRSPSSHIKCLNPKGLYVTIGGEIGKLISTALAGNLLKNRVRVLALKPNKGLNIINKLYAEGKVQPMIDGPYAFEKIPYALQHFGEAKHTGKVVISIP